MSDDAPEPNEKSKRATYDAATRAAVLAALLAGQGVDEIAAAYNIPRGTINAWRVRQAGAFKDARAVVSKREQIGELLIDYLHGTLKTLAAQQRVFADRKWLEQQSASELAVLHGVLTDKAIRLLEALGAAGPLPTSRLPAGGPVSVVESPELAPELADVQSGFSEPEPM